MNAIANVVLAQYSIAVNVKMESRAHYYDYSGESVPIPPRPRLDRQQNATKWHWMSDGAMERLKDATL